MVAKKTPKTVKSIECLFNIKVERLEGYLQSAEMINNFDIAVGIKKMLFYLISWNWNHLQSTIYDHFHEGFFTDISSDTLATL